MAFNDYAFLGIIKRANALVSGDRMLEGVRNKKVYLVLLSRDASQRSQKVIRDKCSFYGIPLLDDLDGQLLHANINQTAIAIGITNVDMANKVLKESR